MFIENRKNQKRDQKNVNIINVVENGNDVVTYKWNKLTVLKINNSCCVKIFLHRKLKIRHVTSKTEQHKFLWGFWKKLVLLMVIISCVR